MFGDAGPIGGTIVIAANLTTVFTGLAFDTEYWELGQDVYGTWRRVAFSTEPDPAFADVTQADLQALAADIAAEATARAGADTALSGADTALDARTDVLESTAATNTADIDEHGAYIGVYREGAVER